MIAPDTDPALITPGQDAKPITVPIHVHRKLTATVVNGGSAEP